MSGAFPVLSLESWPSDGWNTDVLGRAKGQTHLDRRSRWKERKDWTVCSTGAKDGGHIAHAHPKAKRCSPGEMFCPFLAGRQQWEEGGSEPWLSVFSCREYLSLCVLHTPTMLVIMTTGSGVVQASLLHNCATGPGV